ncbi:acid phosphatase [Gandjariella thermophila]|uniref:Acid phosphatase n=1 Tax=Gandjariella thermophila TaxID=1931992 RepID=A0A4D4JB30_9PSEU|nr:acid phosphatase [Gandjariella thermophila]
MVVLALAGCVRQSTAPAPESPPTSVPGVPAALPRPDHVLVVIFENKSYAQVIGAPEAPYLTSLARAGANFTDAHGETHPSQPNYVRLLSGSTRGVTDDSCPRNLGDAPNLARQLLDAGLSFAGYSEDLPADGFTGCASPDGRYARKHNPWADFASVPAAANRAAGDFPADLATLPTVSFLIPNMCDDMHDCPVSAGDAWAGRTLPGYVDWAAHHNSLLIVTFDEDNGTADNHIPTILVGPMVRPGDTARRINHDTLLRTLEDMYGLPPLGAAAATPPITGIWTTRP